MCWYKVQERTFHEKLVHFDGNATCVFFQTKKKEKDKVERSVSPHRNKISEYNCKSREVQAHERGKVV